MRRLLVFQHVPHEILGTFDPLLKAAGFRIRYINFGRQPHARPRLDGYSGLVVLGGPMNVDQVDAYPHLETEMDAIREAVVRGIPVMGICLGAQLAAAALGARINRNPVREIGWYDVSPTPEGLDDPLFRHFAGTRKIFQWHGYTFGLPQGAVLLASSPDCKHQAFRYGENVYGLQFHLEVDQPLIERWLKTPGNMREIKGMAEGRLADQIRRDTARYARESRDLGDQVFGEFLGLFHHRRRRLSLPSR